MTKEEAKHLAEVLKAFSENKPIQALVNETWKDAIEPYSHMVLKHPLRIKPAPVLRPYTYEELKEELSKHTSSHVIWGSEVVSIGGFTPTKVGIVKYRGMCQVDYSTLHYMTWLDDNTPCCVIEQS